MIKNLEIELGAQQPGCFELEGHVDDDTSIYSSVTLRVKGQETDNSGEKESETTNTESNNSDTEEIGKVDENEEKIDYSLLDRDRAAEDEMTKAYQVQQYKLNFIEDPEGFMKLFRTAGTANKISNNEINMIKIDQKHSIGIVTSKEMLNTQRPFFLQGKLEITVPGVADGLGVKPGDGISMGVHTDEQPAAGKTGEDLGIKGISNGLFGAFDTYKNIGQMTCPMVGSWSTNSKGVLAREKEKSVVRNGKTGVSAVFGPEFKLKNPTPVDYRVFYDSEQSRSLSVSCHVPDSPGYSNSYNIPENIRAVNFYTAAVSGGSTSKVNLIVEGGQAIVYKTEKPIVELLKSSTPERTAKLSLASSRDGHPLYQTGTVVKASLYNELDKLIKQEEVSLGSERGEISVPITDDTMFMNISVEERYTSIEGKQRTARSSDETRVRIDGGTVNVRYVNHEGQEIAPAENITGKYNAPYKVEPKGISGYTFDKDVDNNRKGNIPKKGETITGTYIKTSDKKRRMLFKIIFNSTLPCINGSVKQANVTSIFYSKKERLKLH